MVWIRSYAEAALALRLWIRRARAFKFTEGVVSPAPPSFGVGKVVWAGVEIPALAIRKRRPKARKTVAGPHDL
jgi:hypothetical protein